MGKKVSKATKKFQKNHLSRELTKRKHDQKKKQIREKNIAKYAPKEGDEHAGSDGEEGEEAAEVEQQQEEDIFASKAKSKPTTSRAAARSQQPAASKAAPPAKARKAPAIEDLDVDQFMDGAFLEDDDEAAQDDSAVDDEGEEDEEMADGAEAEGEGDDEAALLADIERHEAELLALQKSDPEFYAHLQQEDSDLLKFNAADEMRDEAEDDAAVADDAGAEGPKQEVLTLVKLRELKRAVMPPTLSVRALKKFVRVFRSAVRIGSVSHASKKKGEDEAALAAKEAREAAWRREVAIHDPRVFQELIRFAINDVTRAWSEHFAQPAAAAGKKAAAAAAAPVSLEKHAKWSAIGPVLKAFLSHLLHFLSTLHSGESSTSQSKMARFVLGGLEGMIRFFEPFPRLSQKLLKELLELWATSDRNVRIDAFLRIRQMAIELSSSAAAAKGGDNMLELALRGMYLTYVRHSKFTSALTLPVVEFMANCVVELYGLDAALSYQHAFVYIRQLAIHLRQSLSAKTKDAHRQVYNWNYVNSLRVWAKVLAAHGRSMASAGAAQGGNDNLAALVYPFVQICLGTLTVLPSTRYFPLRFHVCRFLIDLTASVRVFVPLAPHLLSVLSAPELKRKPSASTRKIAELGHVLKASKHVTSTKMFQEAAISEALHLLLEYFAQFGYSLAFPELILPTLKQLRRAAKEMLITRVRKQISAFVLKLEHNASWIVAKRNGCEYAPRDMLDAKKGVDAIDSFKPTEVTAKNQAPIEKYVQLQIQQRQQMDDAKADWDGSKGSRNEPKRKKGGDSDDEDEAEEAEQHRRKRAREDEGEEEMEDDGYGDEDEDGYGDEYDDAEEEGEDEDDQPRKKSKGASGAPRPAFEYPSDADEDDGQGDLLEEMAFSDDEDEKPRKGGNKSNKNKQQGGKNKQIKQEGKQTDKKRKRK